MSHWAEQYIGRPWVNGAQGPEAFDCWGFVRFVFAAERGIALPVLDVDADRPLAIRHAIAGEQLGEQWQPVVGVPDDWDVCLLSQARHPDHVGLWVAGQLLHCIRGSGVVYQSPTSLQRTGWNVVANYRRVTA